MKAFEVDSSHKYVPITEYSKYSMVYELLTYVVQNAYAKAYYEAGVQHILQVRPKMMSQHTFHKQRATTYFEKTGLSLSQLIISNQT